MEISSPGTDRQSAPRASYLPSSPEYRSSYRRQLAEAARRRGLHEQLTPLSRTLGWFSIGMGMVHLLSPRMLASSLGIQARPGVIRAIGAREIVCGVGILRNRQPSGWLWSRVAGDAMDLGLMGIAARRPGNDRRRIAYATAAAAAITVLDVAASVRHAQPAGFGEVDSLRLEKAITVNRSPDEVYQFWRDFENFPRFMKHIEAIDVIDSRRSHWRARGPMGHIVEWDAEISIDQPGKMLAWRSIGDAEVSNAGTVRFEAAPGGRGTIVHVTMHYRPPGGRFGALLARLSGEEPKVQVEGDLRRFKQLIETGEIPTIEGQPSGRRSALTQLLRRVAP